MPVAENTIFPSQWFAIRVPPVYAPRRAAMASFPSILLAAALVAVPQIAGAGNSTANFLAELAAGHRQKVVVYGTSLTANAAWPAEFEETLRSAYGPRLFVSNAAGGGKDSRWGVAHLDQRVLRQRPDTVFIEFGTNDALEASKLSVGESMANLEWMIARIREERQFCDIVIMIMNPPTGDALAVRPRIKEYEQGYRRVAEWNHCRLIDFSVTWRTIIQRSPDRWRTYAPDGLHPNALACREVILPKLLEKSGFYAQHPATLAPDHDNL